MHAQQTFEYVEKKSHEQILGEEQTEKNYQLPIETTSACIANRVHTPLSVIFTITNSYHFYF